MMIGIIEVFSLMHTHRWCAHRNSCEPRATRQRRGERSAAMNFKFWSLLTFFIVQICHQLPPLASQLVTMSGTTTNR
jgi:hypothetical protein